MNGAACSADGVEFDGKDDYVDIDDWEWGGATSFEAHLKYDSFNSYSRVFDFGNVAGSDNVLLCNAGNSSTIWWDVRQGFAQRYLATSKFDSSTWTHVLITVKDTTMKVYKNGALVDTKNDGWEPYVLTRTQHLLGNRFEGDRAFDGTIAYLKMWHDVEVRISYFSIPFCSLSKPLSSSSPHPSSPRPTL